MQRRPRARLSCGMTAPNRNAPKIAWMPIASVVSGRDQHARRARRPSTPASAAPVARSPQQPGDERPHHDEHDGDEAERSAARPASAPPARRLRDADDERQQAPGRDVVDGGARQRERAEVGRASCRRSVRMRASTGNAVIDIATPRNSAKLVNGTSLVEKPRIETERQRRPRARTARRCSACEIATVAPQLPPQARRGSARGRPGTCRG